MDASNRRRYGRRIHYQPVLLERVAAPGGTFALIRNVSLGGVGFVSLEPLGESQAVRATFQLDKEFLEVEGRIVWERAATGGRYESAVEFTRMDPLHRAVVRRAVSG